ncbi:hypothetical protein [Escherichia coli]|uniref:hypothetical protein n=1 Tax=Escherichia coli TaxID=562 RepID=UPI0020366861|nr:hypothetical protein [Escherichia coli]
MPPRSRRFPAWARHSTLKRARVMFRFKALLEENMERLARLISEEHVRSSPTR